jgi:hypothetical protein
LMFFYQMTLPFIKRLSIKPCQNLIAPWSSMRLSASWNETRLMFAFLLETKLSYTKVGLMHRFQIKSWKFLCNSGVASNARIVIF